MLNLLKYNLPAATIILLIAGTVHAQIVNEVFFQPGTSPASWATGTNWSDYGQGQNVPEGQFDERAIINGGETAQITSAFPVGTSGATNGPGELQVLNGTLEIQTAGLLGLSEPTSSPTVNRSVLINDTLNIQGAGQLLNASTLTFGNNATYDLDLTASTTLPIDVVGLASLNGTLDLDFSAFANPIGTYNLLSAGSFAGNFSTINTTALSSTQGVILNSGGGLLSATVSNLPTLTINRDTGTAVLENTNGAAISLDGYSISSGLGGLDESQFGGLSLSGWLPSGANSSTVVADTFEGPNIGTPTDSLASGIPLQVGNAGFWSLPAPQAFLQETEDVILEFTDPALGNEPLQAVVNFVGEKIVNNNIALTINAAGEAVMLNQSPFPQDVEVYRITSSGSPLQTDTWDPLQNQVDLDNSTWQVSALSDTAQLFEVTEVGSSNFDGFTLFEIGQILDPGFAESGITFEFLLAGESTFTTGAVLFDDHPEVSVSPGDFNGDGIVDAADYTVWRDNLGTTDDGLILSGNGTGGTVDATDYNLWVSTYGTSYGSASALTQSVPEPTSVLLVGLALAGACYVPVRH